MLELTTINTTELTNKKLGTQLNNIKKAVDTGNNQQWKIAEITDAEDAEITDAEESTVVDESTESSTSNTDDDSLAPIKNLIDTMSRDELLALKEYIEKRL